MPVQPDWRVISTTRFGDITSPMTWRHLSTGLVLAALLLTGSSLASGQTLTSGLLDGVVEDSLGAPLNDARVTVAERTSGFSRSAETGRDGRFRMPLLPPGDYDLLVERFGFQPVRVQGVPVRAGQRLTVPVVVAAAGERVDEVEVVRFEADPVGGTRAGVSQWFSTSEIAGLPHDQRQLTALGELSTTSNSELETEGLPARLSSIVVDGLATTAARHPDLAAGSLSSAAFPLSEFEHAELILNAADVEWSGFSGGLLSGYTRRGTREFQVRAFGGWAGDALFSSGFTEGNTAAYSDILGGVLVSGPIVRDTASFVIGVEARRLETPTPPLWSAGSLDPRLVEVARDSLGVDLSEYEASATARTEFGSAFGRIDWQLGREHSLSVRGNLATIPFSRPFIPSSRTGPLAPAFDGSDFSIAATLTSALSDDVASEFRVGFETSRRDYGGETLGVDDDTPGAGLPSTFVVAAGSGSGFGSYPTLPGRFERSTLRVTETLHYETGAHRLKGGVAAVLSSYDQSYTYGTGGEFFFGGVEQFARGRSSFVQTGRIVDAAFNVPQFSVYAQDTWSASPGVDVLLGMRLETEQRPRSEIVFNSLWEERSGLRNDSTEDRRLKLSPRIGLTWDVQNQHRWIIRSTAGVYHDMVDPGVLAEVIGYSQGVEVRRGVGRLSNWPTLPSSTITTNVGSRLALLGPNFDAPRTSRVSLGVTRLIGSLAALHLSTTYRRTDFLPRRDDLNRLASPLGTDQYGRPLYGLLIQQGGIIAAAPGSNRRFRSFDLVSAINADGRSDYRGVTLALERRSAGPVSFSGSYTYSETTDNWLSARGGGPDAQLNPFPDSLNGQDWADGRSDFDLPHRLVLSGEFRLPAPLTPRLAAFYRYRSGYPFTPGFPIGVDANGDGSARNDPAWVDEGIPGTADLMGRWDCLRSQVGRFAERNVCREPGVHSLDLRLGVDVIRTGRYTASVVIDGFNLVGSEVGDRDTALYLVDPSQSIAMDNADGEVSIPLIANPNFGQLLVQRTPGRALRIGLQLNY